MAEQEELQLRVSLDDQASAQLAALRGQLDQMRGTGGATAQIQQAAPQIVAAVSDVVKQLTAMGEQIAQLPTQITAAMSGAVQSLGQVQTQLTQISTQVQQSAQVVAGIPGHVAQGTQALTTAVRQAGFFGGIAAGVTQEFISQLSKLGNNLLQRATDFHGLADSMKEVETRAKGVGMSMPEYIGEQRALQIGGMTPEQAKAEISRRADLSAELKQYGAENAPTTLRMIQDTDPETTNNIIKTMKAMEDADPATQTKLWNQLHDAIQRSMTLEDIKQGRKHPGEGFEGAWKQLSERAGMDPAAYANFDYSKYEEFQRLEKERDTPARQQMFRDRTEETKRLNRESLITSFLWKDIGESLAASLTHGLEVTGVTKELNTWLDRILTDAEAFEKVWRETDFKTALEELKKLDPVIAPYVEQIKQLADGLKATAVTTIAEFQAILPIIHAINDLLGKLGLGPPKDLAPPGTPEREQQDREEAESGGALGAGYVHRLLLRHGLKPNLTPGGDYVEPEPESPETSTLSPLRRLLDYNRRQREAEQKELERQQSLQPAQSQPPAQLPAQLPPSPPAEMSEAERRARENVKGIRVPGQEPTAPAVPAVPAVPEAPAVSAAPPPPPLPPPEMSEAERAARERMKGLRVPQTDTVPLPAPTPPPVAAAPPTPPPVAAAPPTPPPVAAAPPTPPPEASPPPPVQTVPPPEAPPPPVPPLDRLRGMLHLGAYDQEGGGQPITVTPAMLQAKPEGGGQQVSPDAMQALIKSAQPEVDGQPSGLHEGIQLAGYKSRVASEIVDQFTTPKGLVRSGADFVEMAKGGLAPKAPTALDAIMSALPLGLGAIPEFIKEHEKAGDPLLQKLRFGLGVSDANVPDPSPWVREGGAWHQGKTGEEVKQFQDAVKGFADKAASVFPHRGDWQPGQDEAEDKAAGFGERFGIWPGMGADKLDQTSNKLDQAANQNVNISGAGKIQVDVRAPPGTSVDATGEGFFKSTEITRLTQMLPADMGPLPMTGVGAGQGVAGNGTVSA